MYWSNNDGKITRRAHFRYWKGNC